MNIVKMADEWRKQIINRLQERNKRQCSSFISLIQAHNKLSENADSYKTKNVRLAVEVEKLKQENIELSVKVDMGGGGKGGTGVDQQKLFRIQEELTELHRKKGENSQQIIDLKNALQDKEKEIQSKENMISDMEKNLEALQKANSKLEASLSEATTTNQMLTDEQQALQLAYISLEEKFRILQEDNNDLVTRWMQLKSQNADTLNLENEKLFKKRQQKIKEELTEAASVEIDVKDLDGGDRGSYSGPMVGNCCVVIPERALHSVDGHEGEVNSIKWSTSGRMFATGGTDRKLKLWEVQSGKIDSKGSLMGSNAAILSIEFDYEDKYILAASNDFASRVWTISNQRVLHTLTGHSGKVLAAKFLGDSSKVASGSHDRTLKIWDLKRAACTKTIFAGSSCNDLICSDGFGTNVISGHFDKKIRFWDSRSETSTNEILLQGRVTSLDLTPEKTELLACSRDDTLKIIDLRMNQVTCTLSADDFHVGCDWTRAVFSPDGLYVMAGSQNGSIFVWNVAKKKVEKVLKEHNAPVIACSWSPGGSSLLSCDKHRKIVYWSDF